MKILAKFIGYSSIAVMLFVFTSMACAQLPETDHAKTDKKRDDKFAEIVKELKLTAEQQQAVTLQRSQEKAQSQELRQKTRAVRDQITQELNNENTDIVKVNELVSQLKELTARRIEQQIQGIMSLKLILTPAQFKTLNEKRLKEEKERKRGGKHE
jgi:Spy/CpxP family protein refolding chaperone